MEIPQKPGGEIVGVQVLRESHADEQRRGGAGAIEREFLVVAEACGQRRRIGDGAPLDLPLPECLFECR